MKLGVIGGSGLYHIEHITNLKQQKVITPFGEPSDEFICGDLAGTQIFFLPRHGRGHTIMPSEINHRANIFAMKKLGVTHIISISAVGSLKAELRPQDVVIVDQYVDHTKRGADHTFFGKGIVAHIAFGNPVCPELSTLAQNIAEKVINKSDNPDRKVHGHGTYVNMEGPAFSTFAESQFNRSMGWDVIGMTNLAEAKLAREAEICYSTIAMVTDYDCWHPDHDHVTVELIIEHLMANTALAKGIVEQIAGTISQLPCKCRCQSALASAIISQPEAIPAERKVSLQPIIGKYIKND
jgi:5'-methylthioadenosine phosphorylase